MPIRLFNLRLLTRVLFGGALLILSLGFLAPVRAQNPATPAASAAIDCALLPVARDWGGIPEAPTRIDSASLLAATATTPAQCLVTGYISPQVQFELHLPADGWTGQYFQAGCGGLCGQLRESPECLAALGNGMATGYSDLGHHGSGGQWGAFDTQLRIDFGYRANHVLSVVAREIIATYYGQPPAYSYFVGCSDGGREALMEAQRFPDDFDGIVAGAPAAIFTALNGIKQPWAGRANLDDQGLPILTADLLPRLHDAVITACDANDGVTDGIISDPLSCSFDPASLACPNDAPAADCLTAAQVDVVRKLYAGPVAADGTRLYPGGEPYGSELEWAGQAIVPVGGTPFYLSIGNDFVRYLSRPVPQPLEQTASTIPFTVAQLERYREVGEVFNAVNPDLTAFRDGGGKLLLYHGLADPDIPWQGTAAYYTAVEQTMGGSDATREFARLFLVPGMGHCGGGAAPTHFDMVAGITAWVEHGAAPDQIIATQYASDTVRTHGDLPSSTSAAIGTPMPGQPVASDQAADESDSVIRTRPLFPYPLQAEYTGNGSGDDAANFVAVLPHSPPPDLAWAGSDLFAPPDS